MSADNWATCPRCEKRRTNELRESAAKVARAYGKVPVEEWDQMRKEQADAEQVRPERTFREDYEFFGAEDGVVTASYRGNCMICGLTLEFEDRRVIPGVDA